MISSKKYIYILLLIFSLSSFAQSPEKANNLFESGKYEEALVKYEKLYKKNPRNILYTYRLARCYQENSQWDKAIPLFDKTGKKYPLTYLFLGECYQALWQSEEAVNAYKQYLTLKPHDERKDYIQSQIEIAEKRQRYIKRVADLQIIDSVIVAKQHILDAYTLSEESGKLLSNEQNDYIYENQRGDRRYYAIDNDSNRHIFQQYRLLADWAKAEQLPQSVNRSDKQDFPFVMSDGVTMYFASQSEDGLGGWDIYMSRYNSSTNSFTNSENIGFPFNSEYNDYLYAADEQQGIGYFATDRFCSADSVIVYRFVLEEQTNYLPRTMESDSLALYAQLKTYHVGTMPERKTEPQHEEKAQKTESIRFVINDEVIYTSIEDFRTEEGKALFGQLQECRRQLQDVEKRLSALRQTYQTSSGIERSNMSEQIITAEQDKEHLQGRCKQLEQQIRVLEQIQ